MSSKVALPKRSILNTPVPQRWSGRPRRVWKLPSPRKRSFRQQLLLHE